MSRLVNAAATLYLGAGLLTFLSAAASWGGDVISLNPSAFNQPAFNQDAATAPKWLTTTSQSGLYLGPNGFSQGTRSETSVNLGAGLTAGLFSSLSNTPANTFAGGSLADPIGRWATGGHGALNTGLNPVTGGFTGSSTTSTFGGRMSQDLGGGVSVNFVGAVARDPSGSYYLGPRGALSMNAGGAVSTSFGGGMSVDLGGGSSFSVSGTVSKNSGRCDALATGFCR